MPNISFAGPAVFERSKYYNPSKSYINDKNSKKPKVDPNQKVAELFYNFYIDNKETLPPKKVILKHRVKIEIMILQGALPEVAYKNALSRYDVNL